MIETAIFISVLVLLTAASSFFSSSETALFSLSSQTLKTWESSSNIKERLVTSLLKSPRDLLVTIFMFNTLVNILLQNAASSFLGESASWALKVAIPFFITLIFGEIIPKNIGMENNKELSVKVASPIDKLHRWIAPLRRLTIKICAPLTRILFFFLKKDENISKEELEHVLAASKEHGILEPDEARLLLGFLDVQSRDVKEVMWPREDILLWDIEEPLSKLVHLFVDKECSRLPVVHKELDNILGVITARNFFLNQNDIHQPEDVKKFLRAPFYTPESSEALVVLKEFEERGEDIALVVDEYGAISGLVAKEDIIEVVIGEIQDQRDQQFSEKMSDKSEMILSAKMELSEFNALFSSTLKSRKEMVTIGGWIIEQLGDIPKAGMLWETEEFLFQILQADPTRIKKIYVRKLKAKS